MLTDQTIYILASWYISNNCSLTPVFPRIE